MKTRTSEGLAIKSYEGVAFTVDYFTNYLLVKCFCWEMQERIKSKKEHNSQSFKIIEKSFNNANMFQQN